jgi:excisionase family DNA binding protein
MSELTVNLLSTAIAGKRLGVHPQTIRNWIREGRLRGYRVGHQLRVDPADLAAFLRPGDAS